MIVGMARIETVPRSALAVSNLPPGSRRLTSADLAGHSLFQTGSVNLTQVRNRGCSRPGQLHLIQDSGIRDRAVQNFGINKHLFHLNFLPWYFGTSLLGSYFANRVPKRWPAGYHPQLSE